MASGTSQAFCDGHRRLLLVRMRPNSGITVPDTIIDQHQGVHPIPLQSLPGSPVPFVTNLSFNGMVTDPNP